MRTTELFQSEIAARSKIGSPKMRTVSHIAMLVSSDLTPLLFVDQSLSYSLVLNRKEKLLFHF